MTIAVVSIEHSISEKLVYSTIEVRLFLRPDDQFDNQPGVFSFSAKELKMDI